LVQELHVAGLKTHAMAERFGNLRQQIDGLYLLVRQPWHVVQLLGGFDIAVRE